MLTANYPNTNIRTEVRDVTPEMARILLANNHNNRKLRRQRVVRYASDMAMGQWKLSGEPIIISVNGRLLDGQHRLEGVIESGVTVPMVIVYGVTDDAYTVMDSGLTRSLADPLGANGFAQATLVAAIVRLVIAAESGLDVSNNETYAIISRDDVIKYAIDNRDRIEVAISWGMKAQGSVGGTRTSWAAFAMLAQPAHPVEFATFMDGVINGIGLSEGDPRLALRNWLGRDRGNRTDGRFVYTGTFLRAFNAYLNNKNLAIVRAWRRGEDWPKV